jgi:hypothetical protein
MKVGRNDSDTFISYRIKFEFIQADIMIVNRDVRNLN